MEAEDLARLKKKACAEGRTIVFIDESGVSSRPHRCRTWAPRGETPVLFHHYNWKTISLIAGLTLWNFYFDIFTETIQGPHVIVFLENLQRVIGRPLLVIWDGLPAHRSKLVSEYLATLEGRVVAHRLPPYAPELNPVEYIWAYLKHHELPNVCPKDLWQLGEGTRQALKRMRRRRRLCVSFWKQASLWP